MDWEPITLAGSLGFIGGNLFAAFFRNFFNAATDSSGTGLGRAARSLFLPKRLSRQAEFFSIGRYRTSLFVIDGNGTEVYDEHMISCIYHDGTPNSPDDIADLILLKEIEMEAAKDAGNPKIWDGIGVGLLDFNILRDDKEKKLGIVMNFYKTRYAAFQATVVQIGTEDRNDNSSIYKKYLKDANPFVPVQFLARHVGVVVLVVTADDYLIVTKRGNTGVRSNEIDVSIVEGIEPTKDADISGKEARIDVFNTILRGCDEELGFTPKRSEISLLGFALDMSFYQYNFIALIEASVTLQQIVSGRNGHAKDAWETRFTPVRANLIDILEIMNNEKMWGFASVSLYWFLLRRFPKMMVEAKAHQIVTRVDNYAT